MSVPVDAHEPRPRDGPGEVSPARVGDRAIGAAMHHDRRRAHLLEQRAHVHPVGELQQGRGRLGLRGRSLIAHESPPRLAVLRADEDVGQNARPQPPVRTHRGGERLADVGRRDRGSVCVGPVQQQPIHPLRKPRRERDRSTPARRAPDQGGAIDPQLVHDGAQQSDLVVERQRSRIDVAVRHARPRMVVADQCVARCGRPPEGPERLVVPVQLEMAHPPGGRHQRRPLTADRECDPRASEPQEPDCRPELRHLTRRLLSRPHPTGPTPRSAVSGGETRTRTGGRWLGLVGLFVRGGFTPANAAHRAASAVLAGTGSADSTPITQRPRRTCASSCHPLRTGAERPAAARRRRASPWRGFPRTGCRRRGRRRPRRGRRAGRSCRS